MPRTFIVLLCLVAGLVISGPGCTSKSSPTPDGGSGDAHDHDHDHDGDANHDHDPGGEGDGDGESHGEAHALGGAKIGSLSVEVTQFGEISSGAEVAFEITITAGTDPASIRAWVGAMNGMGSTKGRADKEGEKSYHAHVECPMVIAADHSLWLEVENAAGTKERASVQLHR